MQVLLVRHGTAVSSVGRMPDEHRWLTEEGRTTARRVGLRWAELGVRPTVIYTSPLVRAVQTSERLAEAFACDRVEVHAPLAIDLGTPSDALSVLERHTGSDIVVLVTHEPKVRAIAGSLSGRRPFPGFPTSGSVLFSGERGAMRFESAVSPGTMERIDAIEHLVTW